MRTSTLELLQEKREASTNGQAVHYEPGVELSKAEVATIASTLGLPMPVHLGKGMYGIVTDVSPEHAMVWLEEHNPNNRDEVRGQWQTISRDIAHGKWQLIHQGVAFDEEANLLDGQNRLAGIVEADYAVPVLITIYAGRRRIAAIDQNATRDWRSQLVLTKGEKVSSLIQGVLKATLYGREARSKISHSELTHSWERLRASIEWVFEQFPARIKGVTIAPVLSAITRAQFHVDRARLRRFCEVLRTCCASDDDPAEATPVALRNYLMASITQSGFMTITEKYAKTQWAISKYMQGQSFTKVHAAGAELYPLPEGIDLR